MKRLLIFISAVSFFSEGCAMCNEALKPKELKIMQKAYSGNPLSENLKTYVYLCRKSAGSDKCSDSDRYNGLSVAFVTTDGEFFGFEPEKTANIVWSASTSFRDNGFDIGYVYNYERYKDSGEKIIEYGNDDTGLPDSDEYLHNLNGSPCVSKSVSAYYTEEEELRIVKTLESALFRWEIPGKKLSDILKLMGKVGERREIEGKTMNVIPEYDLPGSDSFKLFKLIFEDKNEQVRKDNCATFSARIISKVMDIDIPVATPVMALKAVGFLGATMIPDICISLLWPGIGTMIGLADIAYKGLTVAIDAPLISYLIYLNTPNGIINTILKLYSRGNVDGFDFFDFCVEAGFVSVNKQVPPGRYADTKKKFRSYRYADTEKKFRIVAHNEEEARENYRKSEYGDENNRGIIVPYNEFELKSVKQAIDSRLRMGKLKREGKSWWKKKKKLVAFLENIFLKSDFVGDSGEQSFSNSDSAATLAGGNLDVRESGASNEDSNITISDSDSVSTLEVGDTDSLTAEYGSDFYLDEETDFAVSEDELCSFLKQAGFEGYSDDSTLVTEYSDYYLTEENLYESEDEYSLFFDEEIRPYLIEDDVAA